MGVIQELVANNDQFARGFDKGDVPGPPAKKVAIVACMDARLDPETFLGLDIGDAHVIRNAGGRMSDDAVRSLIISTHLLGTREFAVIHHTDCGMSKFTNEDMAERLGGEAEAIDFLPFSELEASVREDVERIRRHPLIPEDIPVSGFVYEVETGRLRQVTPAP